ncbi:MAG TPA: UDP-N-acetylmuramate--L-alanine ligase [Anaerolineae bacterium]|nr:UDP-N-acetylmuramate--L-alanine ligase [Anaerolineae bacterium]
MLSNISDKSSTTSPLWPADAHIHLVGIGGAGLSAIAWVLLGRNYTVSGSDQTANARTQALQEAGATIFIGHHPKNIDGADLLLVSSAIPTTNPEYQAALTQNLPIYKRDRFLGHLMADAHGLAIAGTHGKTTTTGLLAEIFITANQDPTVIIGGVLPSWGVNGRAGQGPHFIVEADEYDHMFLGLRPQTAIITNIEHDHPDIFPTPQSYQDAFHRFIQLLPPHGHLVTCYDDPGVQQFLNQPLPPNLITDTYGLDSNPNPTHHHYHATDIRPNPLGGSDFLLTCFKADGSQQMLGLFRLRVPGDHNVRNALAAIAVAHRQNITIPQLQKALISFGGVGRRFQITGEVGQVTIIDDYAHHPTEIRATLAAARQQYPGRRIWAVWQPHTFSRTKLLLQEFAQSFTNADRVIVLDIFRSREKDDLGLSSANVVAAMSHSDVIHIPERRQAADYLRDRVHPSDVVLTLGAGDGNEVGRWLLTDLQARIKN